MITRQWPNGLGEEQVTREGVWEIRYPIGSRPYVAKFWPRGEESFKCQLAGTGNSVKDAIQQAIPRRAQRWES
jgi:hypothetical protein